MRDAFNSYAFILKRADYTLRFYKLTYNGNTGLSIKTYNHLYMIDFASSAKIHATRIRNEFSAYYAGGVSSILSNS